MSSKKVAIYGLKSTEALGDFIPRFFHRLEQWGVSYQIEKDFVQVLKGVQGVDLEKVSVFSSQSDLWEDLDLFFTFGGDGTILSAVTVLQDRSVPIVGVNTGRLGYLAGINKKELLPNLEDIIQKDFKVSERCLLDISTPGYHLNFPFALNEITVMRKETTSMITIDAYIGEQIINSFWCDGLIISTPTGSTGYSLSCNGPIISPETENFVITPIAPHNLNVRPLVISNKEEIRLKVHSRVEEYSMSLDSRLESLGTEQEIWVKKADFKVNIVQLNHSNYLETLRKKLFWGKDKRN
ncbi:NAD kinase [Flavobacteriaceae bacterium Ap0902]|nr:NAD kinase [Flavobacteriaceae bacterium Ap0902]